MSDAFERNKLRDRRLSGHATALALLALSGCAYDVETEDVSVQASAILNGTPITADNSGVVEIEGFNEVCTGRLLRNRWLLTASHCVELHLDRDYTAATAGF